MTCKLCSINHFLVFTDLKYSFLSIYGNNGRSDLNGEENIVLTGNDPPFAPLVGLKKFSLSELKAAIKDGNTIGRGGFSNVYKGILNDGTVVTIKRAYHFTYDSSYDQHRIVSKLQHKNIVKVLGYGHKVKSSSMMRLWNRKTDRDKETEYFLVEEYMPNGSLDKVIHESQLNWSSMFRIIQGIAQGVHYLHEQGVIHLDLKPPNILLDSNMNAKITDFDLSVTVDDNEVTLDVIAGTLGYIDPEFLAGSTVTTKNDVYGFGITLLETVRSIRRCKSTAAYPLDQWAWKAWEAGRIDEEFDLSLFDGSELTEIKRCVMVGLLCAQDRRAYRPSMADVLEMLNGDRELPNPKKPAYILSDEERSSADQSDGEIPSSPSAWSDGS
ncbi:hypothetical protein PAHAL_8G255300 [Panicum hallii]|uniref:Protein kinase domain-containing protein n=1 Tax=Panicum hallii TaxID=206008 RepID=A0A2S3IFL9_9POAL|nr:hypothetical protein PAHAL_8G255300 [Panicum hallii]